MNAIIAVSVAIALLTTAVLGCNDLGLFGCTTVHGTKLTARRGLDKIDSSRNYPKSCEYIQDWFGCIATKREGCGSGNVNLKAYNNEYGRLRQSPYSCTVSGASSLVVSVMSLAVVLMAALKMA